MSHDDWLNDLIKSIFVRRLVNETGITQDQARISKSLGKRTGKLWYAGLRRCAAHGRHLGESRLATARLLVTQFATPVARKAKHRRRGYTIRY
jgi:hypothetical protein